MGGLWADLLRKPLIVKMPISTRTETHTLPPRQLYHRNQANDKDCPGASTRPRNRLADALSAVSQRAARFMNAAAQVWGVAELASLICARCYIPPSGGTDAQPRLINLARVNKHVSEAALRHLWRDLPSMRPLLSLLPPDLVDLQFDNEWNPATSPQPVSVIRSYGARRLSHLLLGCKTTICT